MRAVAALMLAGAVPAVLGGVLFWAVQGGTTLARAVAFGLWIAAALLLVVQFAARSKHVWRRTELPVLEGWMFVSAALALTLAGAAIDAAGG